MSQRIFAVVDDDLHQRCKYDAQELRLSMSAYVAMVLKQRHGILKIERRPPKLTELPMHAARDECWVCADCWTANEESTCDKCGKGRPPD